MTDKNGTRADDPEKIEDDPDHALTTTADVESAGRSCVVIIGLTIFILVLLAVWVLYTT